MSDILGFLNASEPVPAFVVLFLLWIVAQFVRWRKKDNKWKLAAEKLGFTAKLMVSAEERDAVLSGSWLLRRQILNRTAYRLMSGTQGGLRVAALTHVTSTGGKGSSGQRETVACIFLPAGTLPVFAIRHRGFGSGIGLLLSDDQEVQVDQPPGFCIDHIITGNDEDLLRKLLTPEWLSIFVNQSALHVESNGGRLLIYWPGTILDAVDTVQLIDKGIRLVTAMQKTMIDCM